jgi:multidrug efflux pump subunit AcrB
MNEYLQNTKFNPKNIHKFVRGYLGNMRIVILLVISLLAGGFLSYKALPQTVAPEINLSMLVVSSSLPGAPPEDVERLLTMPIEDELKGIANIDTIISTSENSYMYSVLTFGRGVEESRALDDVENAVRRVDNLPEDATDPRVKAIDFEDYPIIRVALNVDGNSSASLAGHTQKLIDTLEADSLIDRVITAGQPEQEVQVTISSEKMAALGLQSQSLKSAIQSAVSTLPSGTIEDVNMSRALTINTSIDDVDDLRSLPLSINSQSYLLGDIATITERPAPGHTKAWLADNTTTRSIAILDIHRTSGADLTESAKVAEEIINEVVDDADDLHQTILLNMSTDQVEQFTDLVRNLGITVLLVFLTLMLFVGWRQAFLAAFSIPLTYAVAFIVMNMMGLTVNFLSLFSLLLSLGLLVDVTIVVVSAMSTYIKEGLYNSYKTGLLVYRDFFVTLLITTLTTVWAFVPLLLTSGMMGEYLRSIPIIVSSILLASVFVGIFIILPLMIWLFDFAMPKRVKILLVILSSFIISFFIIFIFKLPLPFVLVIGGLVFLLGVSGKKLLTKINTPYAKGVKNSSLRESLGGFSEKNTTTSPHANSPTPSNLTSQQTSLVSTKFLEKFYKKILSTILSSKKMRRKTIVIVVLFFIFSFSLVATGLVKNEFFPGEDVDFFYVTIELPEGTKASITDEITKKILPNFSKLDGVKGATSQTGFEVDNHGSVNATSPNIALLTILTPKKDKGGIGSQIVAEKARMLPIISEFTKGKITVSELTGGPPAGADVVVTFVGDELNTLRGFANELKTKLGTASIPVENIVISPRLAAATVEFIPNDALLASRGLTREMIAGQLYLFANGFTLADDVEFTNLTDKRDIVLRFDENVPNLETLGRIMIPTANGNIPLESLGSLHLTQNVSRIVREDFDRTVTLTANLSGDANLVEVNKKIAKIVNKKIVLPAGYSWTTGGANQKNQESVQSILQGMLLAFVLIFLTLIIHLKSYRKAMIVLLTIPPAASGVFVIFALTGISLSFPALIGVLALFGIVVNNAIIVVSQINANQKVGMNYKQSIVEGASSRLEPILLSSLTTIIGLLPITFSDPVWQGLGGAIISGLLFSGTIMLFFVPVVYYAIMGDEN